MNPLLKKVAVSVLMAFTVFLSLSLTSLATTILPGPETPLQVILDNITLPTASNPSGNSTTNVHSDQVSDDSYWAISAAGGSVTTFLIEISANANSNAFGIFSADQKVQLFGGPAGPGNQSLISIKADGSVWVNFADTGVDFAGNVFGYYIGTPSGYFYSDSTKNSDGYDHMVAFQGKDTDLVQTPGNAPGIWGSNEYILAFEDAPNGGDKDYNDLVVMVESVKPVPEPASCLLLGIGMVGVSVIARRRKSRQ